MHSAKLKVTVSMLAHIWHPSPAADVVTCVCVKEIVFRFVFIHGWVQFQRILYLTSCYVLSFMC